MTKAEKQFRLDILGPRPQDVPARDLADFIQKFDAAVRAELAPVSSEDSLREPADAELDVLAFRYSSSWSETADEPTISLVAISEGSDRLHFAVAPRAIPAVARISRSLASQDFTLLTRTAWQALHDMSQVTKRRAWGVRLCKNAALSIEEATVPIGGEVPAPDELPAITGTTVIRARVIRAGGAKPRAELRVPNRSSLLYVDVSEADAKFLGQ
jgi:hypothetical protein